MQIADNPNPVSDEIRDKMEHWREQLLAFGMVEPTRRKSSSWHWLFFKPITELTAFVVNLTGDDCSVEVVYGYASTAFSRFAGSESALIEWGVSDEDITVREKIVICDDNDERAAARCVSEMYRRYYSVEKNELLLCAKEKRKEFINRIAAKLKPLGFKKNANTWTKALESDHYVMFNAQKSAYSDEYYFNVYIGKNGTNDYGDCYYTRVAPNGMGPMDWQALSKDELDFFLDRTVVPALESIIHTPLQELGKIPAYWVGCHCDRKKCEYCWMEKNLWDAKE